MATIQNHGNALELRDIIPAVTGWNRQWLHFWNSPESFAAHAMTTQAKCWQSAAWGSGDAHWSGTESMLAAVKLARDGWPEGADKAAKLRDRINAANPTGPRVIKWDVAGATPSVPRALAGNPLNMRRVDSAKLRRRPVLTLVSDMTVHAGINGDVLARRAAVVAAVVDAVEAAGFSAQVIGTAATAGDSVYAAATVVLKESDQQADIGRLAFGLGHPAMFRRLMFSAYSEDRFTAALGSSLGCPQTIQTSGLADRNIFVLPSAQNASELFKSDDKAATDGLQMLIAALQTQGCPAFPAERQAA